MKTIRDEYVHKRIMKKVYKLIFSFVLIFTLVFIVPGGYHYVHAAPLEDCDLDGFDDATGVPVPWPGYDETKGDTPDGPGGSKTPTAAPSSTESMTTGNSNNEAPNNTGSEATDKANNVESGTTNDVNSGNISSTKSESTANTNSDKTSNVNADNTNSLVKDNTKQLEAGKTTSATSSDKNSTKQDNINNEKSDNTNSTVQDNVSKEETGNTSNATSSNTNSTVPSEGNNQNEVSQNGEKPAKENLDNGITVNTDTAADEIETIINTKGAITLTDASGSIIHAGSSVLISGTGFTGNVQNFEIQIQPDSRQLGIVESSAEGSFEAQFAFPEDLEAGVYQIAILYQGKEIIQQQIDVGPKPADSFLQAISVGFTKDNKGLLPGLFILLGLFVVGVGVLGVKTLFPSNRRKVIQ